jgi:MFS family permease
MSLASNVVLTTALPASIDYNKFIMIHSGVHSSMNRRQNDNTVTRYVGAHGVAQLLFWSSFYYVLPALTAQVVSETNWPVLHISTTYTLAFILWAVCAPLVGFWIDAGHGALVMRIGASVGIVLLAALSQTTDKTTFSVLVILLGACMAATLYDPCFAVILQRLKDTAANAVATVTLIAGFATLLTFPLISVLSSMMTWQNIVLSFAGLASVGLFLLPAEADTKPRARQHLTKMRLDKGPMLIALSFGLVMMGHAILLFLLPVALAHTDNDTNVGLLALAILGPAQVAGRIAWKYFGAEFKPQNCAIVMFACLCLPATLLLIFGTTSLAVCAALALQGACYGVHTILRPSLAQYHLQSSQLGRGLGMIAMVGLLLMAIGPVVGGIIWTVTGLTGLMAALLIINLTALGLGVVLCRTAQKEVMV